MTEKNLRYRPIWTCGRYNEKARVAIFYNLIAGMSYYFEDYSAEVIGRILEVGRNEQFFIDDIAMQLNIAMDSMLPFFAQLEQMGLVSSVFPSKEIIADYRKRQSEYNCHQTQTIVHTTQEKLPYAVSNAESLYTEKAGGIASVMFELTYNCSEQCVHCYNEGATRNNEEISHRGDRIELTLDDYKRVIDQLYEQGLFKACISGGDPFSKNIAWDIIDYLYHKGIAFDVFTNGQRIVDKVEKLADYFPRSVDVSIYSSNAEVHDYITRIKGSWSRSVSVIKQLSALAVPMNVKCCIMQPNLKSYRGVADIAKKYGAVPQFEVSITDSIEGDKCASRNLRLTPKQLDIVLQDDNVPLYVGKEAPNYGGQPKNVDDNPCGAGYNSFCITPEGNFIPCCAFHTLFGNVKRENVSQILKSENLAYWRHLKLSDYEECGNYKYCNYCNLCPGNNFSQNGTPLKASENNCYMAKVRYDLAIRLQNGEKPLKGTAIDERLAEFPDYRKVTLKRMLPQNNHCDTSLK